MFRNFLLTVSEFHLTKNKCLICEQLVACRAKIQNENTNVHVRILCMTLSVAYQMMYFVCYLSWRNRHILCEIHSVKVIYLCRCVIVVWFFILTIWWAIAIFHWFQSCYVKMGRTCKLSNFSKYKMHASFVFYQKTSLLFDN